MLNVPLYECTILIAPLSCLIISSRTGKLFYAEFKHCLGQLTIRRFDKLCLNALLFVHFRKNRYFKIVFKALKSIFSTID